MEGLTSRDFWYVLGLSGIFMALLLLISAANSLLIEPMRKRRRVAKRLAESSEDYLRRVQIIKAKLEDRQHKRLAVIRFFIGPRRLIKLQRKMLQADIYREPSTFLGVVCLLAAVGFLIGLYFLRSAVMGLIFAAPLAIVPFIYLQQKRIKKSLVIEAQMPDAMELLARSLRAGHTLPSAVELLGEEMEHPLGTEMRIAYEEQRFGLSIPDALINLLERVDSQDLRYFVTAVLIQSETGGNLVEIIQKIAALIRIRLNFKAKLRALTAQGRMSAIILTILPIVMFFMIFAIRKDYEMALIETPTGRAMLLTGIFMVVVGAFVMRRFIKAVET